MERILVETLLDIRNGLIELFCVFFSSGYSENLEGVVKLSSFDVVPV